MRYRLHKRSILKQRLRRASFLSTEERVSGVERSSFLMRVDDIDSEYGREFNVKAMVDGAKFRIPAGSIISGRYLSPETILVYNPDKDIYRVVRVYPQTMVRCLCCRDVYGNWIYNLDELEYKDGSLCYIRNCGLQTHNLWLRNDKLELKDLHVWRKFELNYDNGEEIPFLTGRNLADCANKKHRV